VDSVSVLWVTQDPNALFATLVIKMFPIHKATTIACDRSPHCAMRTLAVVLPSQPTIAFLLVLAMTPVERLCANVILHTLVQLVESVNQVT